MPGRDVVGFLAAAFPLALLACAPDPMSPSTATLDITVVTVGIAGTNSYTIRVDSGAPQTIEPNGSLRIPDLAPGTHRLVLEGLLHPCASADSNPRTITLTSGDTLAVELRVVCAPQGSVAIVTRTTGESRDPDGYLLRLGNRPPQRVASDGNTRFEALSPGTYTVGIEDVAPNCSVSAGTAREVTVVDRAEQQVTFEVACTFIGAVRWDTIPLPSHFTSTFAMGKTIWGTSPSDLYVIGGDDQSPGYGGAILHYDGRGWTEQARFPDTELLAIAGVSPTDMYVIGRGFSPPSSGLILHYDGSRWSEIAGPATDPATAVYTNIWRSVGGEVFVIGRSDGSWMIARHNGVTWSRAALPVLDGNQGVTSASGTSATDVWAISYAWNCDDCTSVTSFFSHWDGAQASIEHQAEYAFYSGVVTLAPNNVWVVGSDDPYTGFASIAHWDGVAWSEGPPIPDDYYLPPLADVWASSSSDVYAAGAGILLRFDGSRWSVLPGLRGVRVWGSSRDDVYLLYRDYKADRDMMIHGRP